MNDLTLTQRHSINFDLRGDKMKMQIKEFAEFTGVSVRTLHYYDEIGLLKPAEVDWYSGYRYYDEESILRMQEILFYRELDFSLKTIRDILSSPIYNKNKALKDQKHLLTLKKTRLERLISAIDDAVKGENVMSAFDSSEFKKYKAETQEKWGNTDAYKEHSEKTKDYSKDKWNNLAGEMNDIMAEFSVYMRKGSTPNSAETQNLVRKLQSHISENYYLCTDEILAGLGRMYIRAERFKKNIDKNAIGTAEFVSEAIKVFCGK